MEERSKIDQTSMPRDSKASRRSKEQRKREQGRRFAAESGDLDSLVLDSEDESDEDYEPSSEVREQYRLSIERLRDIVHGDDDDDDDDYEDIEGYSESGYRLVYKDNLVAALQKVIRQVNIKEE